MNRRHALGLWTVVPILALSSCSGGTELPTSGPVAVYLPSGEGGSSARFVGTIELTDGCLTVKSSEQGNDRQVIPLLPREASWSRGVLRFGGRDYELGGAVALDGGLGANIRGSGTDSYLPQACEAGLDVWIVHQDRKTLTPDQR